MSEACLYGVAVTPDERLLGDTLCLSISRHPFLASE